MKNPIDPKSFDQSVKPTDDFFQFVNRKWIEENPIPEEESRWGSFSVLRAEVDRQLKEIFEKISVASDDGLPGRARKVRDFYRTGMDTAARNKLGDAPLSEMFALVDAAKDARDFSRVIGTLHRHGIDAWWVPTADADAKKSDVVALYIEQAGIGLPDRDYYLKDDAKSKEIREKYLPYMKELLLGSPAARGGAEPQEKAIMDIETELAKASWTRVERRDVEKQYNKFTASELVKLAPGIDWAAYFEAVGMSFPAEVIVGQPNFMSEANNLFGELPLDAHKAYLKWHILNDLSHCLDEARERAHFDFYGRTFAGTTEMKPLWRRVQNVVGALLGEAVGELYVKEHFSEEAKKKIGKLVEYLSSAYRARIENLPWMSDETKQRALAKLAAATRKLGYPDAWSDIGKMEIGTDSYARNAMRAHRFEFDRKMKQVGGPVDRSEWIMTPQTVNACYNLLFNEILFPAAILQSPFFDPDADDAVNFGGIGTVIGHELTHGFDDQGSLFDAKGNLSRWWTNEDKERFDAKTKSLAEQFDKFEALPGIFVNGKLTLGENIADLGGVHIAYDALMLALGETGKGDVRTDGLSPAERFFISYARVWRTAIREEALRSQVQMDPHSPGRFRVNGTLSNVQDFFDAFRASPADKLWRDPEDRVVIW